MHSGWRQKEPTYCGPHDAQGSRGLQKNSLPDRRREDGPGKKGLPSSMTPKGPSCTVGKRLPLLAAVVQLGDKGPGMTQS